MSERESSGNFDEKKKTPHLVLNRYKNVCNTSCGKENDAKNDMQLQSRRSLQNVIPARR
jgi:hypothetical protein